MYFVDTWYIFSWLWYILWIFGIFFPGFGILYQENENENEMRKPHQKLFFLFFHDDPSALEGQKSFGLMRINLLRSQLMRTSSANSSAATSASLTGNFGKK
jgi:hypothetical protein